MSLVNAVQFTPTLGGTGDFIVSAAVTGFRAPQAAGMVHGFLYSYRAENASLTEWELGVGTWDNVNNKLVRTTVLINSAGGTTPLNFTTAPFVGISFLVAEMRERMNSPRSIYVGATLGAPTISIATPAVVTLNGHGLSALDRVVFNVPRNTRSATITSANPGVVTLNSHGLVANQPVQFHSTKLLPAGLAPNTTYYVVGASITTNTFQVSATSGGAAINTTALTTTFAASTTITTSAAHNLKVGQIVQFAGTVGSGFSVATDYWVTAIGSATTFSASATPTGAAISSSVATGGTLSATGAYYCSSVGALPTGITEGTTYFVQAAGLTANTFRVSTTSGGADVNTSGTVTGAPVYSVWTGNDNNDGLAATRGNALFTMNAAVAVAQTYDIANVNCTIQICQGVHSDQMNIDAPFLAGTGKLIVQGNNLNSALCSNYVISGGNPPVRINHPAISITLQGVRFGGSNGAISNFAGLVYIAGMCDFGCSGQPIAAAGSPAVINVGVPCIFTATSALAFGLCTFSGQIASNVTNEFLDVPAFTWALFANTGGIIQIQSAQSGSCTGAQYSTNNAGGVYSNAVSGALLGNTVGTATSPGWKT